MDRQYVGITAAAAYLEVAPTTARRWFDDRDLAGYTTPGGHRRVSVEDLQRMRRERISTTVTVLHPESA